jgi:hypothetical protein
MSIKPYNTYIVNDLSGVQQPYVNSCREFGYFGNLGDITDGSYNSMPTHLLTNNGVATVDASNGLHLLNSGVYKLNLSIDCSTTNIVATNGTIYFNFGTIQLSNTSPTSITGSFGAINDRKVFSFGSNAISYPGIISWITNAYTAGTNAISKHSISNNQLVYNYNFNTDASGNFKQGICTTEIIFVINKPTTIFFNIGSNSHLTMGNSYFTLQLICSASKTKYNFITATAGVVAWTGITSDSTGQYVYACRDVGAIFKSSNYGAYFGTYGGTAKWRCISSSSDGTKVCAGTLVEPSNGSKIYFFGETIRDIRNISSAIVSTAMKPDGSYMWGVTLSGTLYYSTDSLLTHGNITLPYQVSCMALATGPSLLFYTSSNNKLFKTSYTGTNNTQLNSPVLNWQGIATNTDGTYLAAVAYGGLGGIYTSSDGGDSWTSRIVDGGNWSSIASSANGSVLAATNPTTSIVKVSLDYGVNWSNYPNITNANSVRVIPDGSGIYIAGNVGLIYYAIRSPF